MGWGHLRGGGELQLGWGSARAHCDSISGICVSGRTAGVRIAPCSHAQNPLTVTEYVGPGCDGTADAQVQ